MVIVAKGTAAASHKYGTKSCKSGRVLRASNQRVGAPPLGEAVEPVVSCRKRKVSVPKESVMRMLSAAAVVVLLTVPAYAQTPNINLMPEFQSKSPEEKEADAIKEKAYKDSLRKIPDAKASSDPWGTVRSTDAPKDSAKAAAAPAKKSKTGSSSQ
jgi:hypothetical protein